LNFTIPRGEAGANGGGGGGASSGVLPVSVYHAVSFSFAFYSLSGATSSAAETQPVLTWMPNACTATTLSVYSQQANPIVVRLRQGMPGAMADTGLVCSVAAAGTCSVTGSVPVAAGSFVDLNVTGADGNPAAVWTALGCS
jgi:collagen type VII alpha